MKTSEELRPYLDADRVRLQALWGIAGGIVLTILGGLGTAVTGEPVLLGVGFVGLLVMLWGFWRSSKYTLMYKEAVIRRALQKKFDMLIFDPEGGFSRQMIAGTEMISMGNRFHSDDYISAEYNGVHFERSDVRIQQVTSNGKTTTVVTLFEGPWMIFDFGKPFRCDLQVTERRFGSNRRHTGLFGFGARMQKLETESEAFNERFNVYAESPHEAFYLLTPQVQERLLSLAARTDGGLMLCFLGGRLHVAVNTGKNAFEPKLIRAPDGRDAARVAEEIGVITSFVDGLKLDETNTLWKGSV